MGFNTFSPGSMDPTTLMMLAAGAQRTGNTVGQYVQNYEKHKVVRGGLYPAPMGRMPRPSNGATPPFNNSPAGMGVDPSQVDAENSALQPFGLQAPTRINPFLFFHDQDADGNATWAGNHPHVARALEGAAIGATTPQGSTIGENISNIMRTVMGIPGLYAQNTQSQMNAPFNEANEILNLRKGTAQIDSENAAASYHRAMAAQAMQKPDTTPPELKFNKGEAVVWNPAIHDFQKRDDLSQDPIRANPRQGDLNSRDYVDMLNRERSAKGQSPLDAEGVLTAKKKFNATTAKPTRQYVDPNLKLQLDEAQRTITNFQNEVSKTGGMPNDPIQATIMQKTDPDRYARVQAAQKNLQDAINARAALLEKHFNYSNQAQQEASNPDTDTIAVPASVDSQGRPLPAIPAAAAPIRMPGTNVTTPTGQPGQLVQDPSGPPGRIMIAPQPGTAPTQPQPQKPSSTPQKSKTVDAATAKALLQEAGGDKDKARALAKQRGLSF